MNKVRTNWGKWSTQFDTKDLLGEIVVIDVSELVVHKDNLAAYATVCDFTEKVRNVSWPDAMRRAVTQLKRRQPVFQVMEDQSQIAYQIGKPLVEQEEGTLTGSAVRVLNEGQVILDKATGAIRSSSDELANSVKAMVDSEFWYRRTSDVSAYVSKVFKNNADLFKLKSSGGAYFVPSIHSGVCDAVAAFLKMCGGSLRRYPVAKGRLTGDHDIRDAVEDGLKAMIEETESRLLNLDETKADKIKAEYDRVGLLQFKLEAYGDYLAEKSNGLKAEVKRVRKVLKEKILAFIDGDADETNTDTGKGELKEGVSHEDQEEGSYETAAA